MNTYDRSGEYKKPLRDKDTDDARIRISHEKSANQFRQELDSLWDYLDTVLGEISDQLSDLGLDWKPSKR